VTSEVFRRPDGAEVHWQSRAHRKGQSAAVPDADGDWVEIWWQPDRPHWWMAVLFSVGSLLFAAGGIASQWALVSARTAAWTFFIGSLFFTAAAYMQYLEAVNAARGVGERRGFNRWRPASWEPKRIDWLATLVQLAGTVLFNISTMAALQRHLTTSQINLRVWAPSAVGAIAFLVSSQLAYAETCHRWFCLRNRSLPWRIVALNVVGSIAFGASAVASLTVSGSGTPVSVDISNAGTWVGGIMFLIGSLLLIPEAAHHAVARVEHAAKVHGSG
jgi:hypothetical protein